MMLQKNLQPSHECVKVIYVGMFFFGLYAYSLFSIPCSATRLGGLWSSKEESTIGLASLYPGLITNTSKEMTCFSDFPMPAEWPNYFTAKEVCICSGIRCILLLLLLLLLLLYVYTQYFYVGFLFLLTALLELSIGSAVPKRSELGIMRGTRTHKERLTHRRSIQ